MPHPSPRRRFPAGPCISNTRRRESCRSRCNFPLHSFHYNALEQALTLIPSLITLPCTNSCLSSLDSLHQKRYSRSGSREVPVLLNRFHLFHRSSEVCVWTDCYKGGATYWVSSALSTTYCGRSLTPSTAVGTLAGTRVNLLQPVIPEAERACLLPI